MRTVIGFGSQHGGTSAVHGAPLGSSDLAFVKTSFGFDPSKSFDDEDDVDNYDSDDDACNLPTLKPNINPHLTPQPIGKSFVIPEEVQAFYQEKGRSGISLEENWNQFFETYTSQYPDLASEYLRRMRGTEPHLQFHSSTMISNDIIY